MTVSRQRKSFTLIELLVVLALVAILSVVVILTLNPAELIKQARDSNRLSDLSTINTALNLFSADVTSGFMGTSTVMYVSIPSTLSDCSNLGLPALPSTYTYNCATIANLRNTDGTGWIPVNFQRISSNSPISQLPVDPINTTSTRLYYTYIAGGSWELNASIEASKNKLGGSGDLVSKDGGSAVSLYEVGNNLNLNPVETGDTSLVGYWNFEEGSNATSSDRSGYGNNGTWYGAGTHYSAGKVGNYAGSFNGNNDYINAGSSEVLNITGDFTFSAWVYPSAIVRGGIFDRMGGAPWYGYIVEFDENGGLYYFNQNTAALTSASTFTVSVWTNIAVVVNENVGVSMYKNGALVNFWAKNPSTPTTAPGVTSYIGRQYTPHYFSGLLDDIRIYGRALSATEILALYNATK